MDYQGNTDKSKDEPKTKEIKPLVLEGEVVVRKKSLGTRFKNTFFGGDAKSAARYVAADVLAPALRDLIVDMTRSTVERIVYGESSRRRRPIDVRSRVQYNSPIYRRDPRDRPAHLPDQPPRYRSERRESQDIVLVHRADAEMIVERLIDIVDTYDAASVADLNELLDRPTSAIDNKWGWTSLGRVEIRQVREGYLIDLPPVEEL